ncbi:MAG TPA: hypothetical protein GXX34_05070 [Clostridia bacterium]|nr:hypothetical protein [Clostridia bacterium]
MKRLLVLLLCLLVALTMTACGGGNQDEVADAPEAGVDYVLDEPVPEGAEDARVIELEFTPQTIIPNEVTMKTGEKILFVIKNTDPDGEHNFLDAASGLPEILVYPSQTVRRLWTAPTTPGEYEPTCTIHPWIKMKFIVEE